MGPREREIKNLEAELDDPDLTSEQRRELEREIRDIERDFSAEEQWREEGRERGWS